jgi:hypothetical protein
MAESREHKSQTQNRKAAFKRLTESDKFNKWLRIEIAKRCGLLDQIEKDVEDAMKVANLLIECQRDGKMVKLEEK